MHSHLHHSRRHGVAVAGLALLTTAALSQPASAVVSIAPNATVIATSGCEGGLFFIHTTMSNPDGGASAHFVVTAVDVEGPITIDEGVDIAPNASQVDDWQLFEGVPGSVHITSDDHDPAVDFFLQVTPDCVSDETIPETVPETIPVTTVVDSSGGGLPSTGATSPLTATLALGLLGAGVVLTRVVRRRA